MNDGHLHVEELQYRSNCLYAKSENEVEVQNLGAMGFDDSVFGLPLESLCKSAVWGSERIVPRSAGSEVTFSERAFVNMSYSSLHLI